MYSSIEESLNRIEEGLNIDQRKGGHRNNDFDQYARELKKARK